MRAIVRLGLLLTLWATSAAAQARPEPQLMLTMFGGVSTGSSLWEINRQLFARRNDPATFDSLRLSRALESGLTLGASATYFRGPNLGFTGEIAYLGHNLDDGCTVVYVDPAVVNAGETEAVCADVSQVGGAAVSLAFSAGVILRLASRGFASPYARLQAGLTARTASTVEMQGRFILDDQLRQRVVLDDPAGGALNPTAALGLGLMIPVGPGYQLRLEARDQLLAVRRATGPAPPGSLQIPPTGNALKHSVALLVMLDIVLEQRRGRRY